MSNVINKINNAYTFIGGAVAYHLVDRVLNIPADRAEEARQQAMVNKIDTVAANQQTIIANQETILANQQTIIANQEALASNPEVVAKEVNSLVHATHESLGLITNAAKDYSNHRGAFNANQYHQQLLEKTINANTNVKTAIEKLNQNNIPDWTNTDAYNEFTSYLTKAAKELDAATDLIQELIKKSTNSNFLPNSNQLFEILNNLTLLQEASLLHIIFFSIIILSIINILGALFGNEVINYFKLEDRFPRLSIFFKVRGVFQRYYLMWSIFILFSVCIAGICINLLLITV